MRLVRKTKDFAVKCGYIYKNNNNIKQKWKYFPLWFLLMKKTYKSLRC
ncbi:MAG: hypothetical protein BAJATHORv1_20111 [Candidatus Thorarchaeota archaeon]|nr:MAG: hypothetical protein BAJATHORv1_20111 [Candidatus Thorarchaeota archaeon]